ncbi:pseudouridine synthase [Virgibacillus xinjiangensis]|uniref:Pseudouridine synthase n=1 Tax=Virgibacillus xinjiangensis TaxID=393090 RepID=A0ABV7CV02_9BACI
MRMDKLLASKGFGSRKEVKTLLKKKRVSVNGHTVKNSSFHVDPIEDTVMVDGEEISYREFIYVMLHKPSGCISATEDDYHKTVIDLLDDDYRLFSPFPVGRLDKDTEGLLLITNDGELAHQLTSPKKEIEKVYYARIDGIVTHDDVESFQSGVTLEDGYQAKPAELKILRKGDISEIEVAVTEGKFHQVKRMFESVGKTVMYLKRERMGELVLDQQLTPGSYRELTNEELDYCLSLKS